MIRSAGSSVSRQGYTDPTDVTRRRLGVIPASRIGHVDG